MNKPTFLLAALMLPLLLSACDYAPSWMGGEKPVAEKLPGERMTVLPEAQTLTADPAVQAIAFVLPPTTANQDWPQHTGMMTAETSNLALSGLLENSASAVAGEGEEFEHPLVPRPVVAAGTVFAMDAVGNISAHDAADIGQLRWQSKGVSEEDEPDVFGGGLAYDQGRLYAASGRGVIVALEATSGKEIWRKSLRAPFRSAPRVSGGKIFAITIDSQLFALDAMSGDMLWSHRGISETAGLMNSVSPAISGGDVIVPYGSGEIYALVAADGRPLWNESLGQGMRTLASATFSGIGGDPVIDSEVVFAVSSGGKLAVFALATGQRLWERPIASINTPWIAGNYLFVLTADNTLACFVKYDGRVRWAVKLPGFEDEEDKQEPILWRGPVMANDKLIIVGSHGRMMLISAADGTVADTKEIPEGIMAPPVVAGGRIYMVGQDARLYSLQ